MTGRLGIGKIWNSLPHWTQSPYPDAPCPKIATFKWKCRVNITIPQSNLDILYIYRYYVYYIWYPYMTCNTSHIYKAINLLITYISPTFCMWMCPVIPHRARGIEATQCRYDRYYDPQRPGVVSCRFCVFVGTGIITLQGTNISHLGKRKIIFKMPFLGGYVIVPWRVNYTTLEGIITIHIYGQIWGISPS